MRRLLVPMIIGVSLLLAASTLTRGHVWGDDFASYIMQAGSILNGTTDEFVEHNAFTIFESSNQIGPVAYPWGYPLILAPIYAIKGIHPLALKMPGLFFYVAFLVCLYFLVRRRLGPVETLLIVCLFAFNPLMLQFLDQILSDIPFLFFSTLALLLLMSKHEHSTVELIVIGIVIFLAFFIRTTGVLLLAAFILAGVFEAGKNRSSPAVLQKYLRSVILVCAVFGVLFLVSVLLFPEGESSHLLRFQEFNVEQAIGFARAYFFEFGSFLGQGSFWRNVYFVLVPFFLLGAWIRRKEETILIGFFVIWMALLIVWPSWQGTRFIFPLLPIFIYLTIQGMKYALGKLPERYVRYGEWALYAFWSLVALSFLFTGGVSAYANLQNNRAINGPFDPYSREVYDYIKQETPADSVVVFFKPRAMRLMTEHDSIMSTECERILKGDILVLSRKVGRNQQIPPEEIDACSLPLNEVLKNNRFIVYEIQR